MSRVADIEMGISVFFEIIQRLITILAKKKDLSFHSDTELPKSFQNYNLLILREKLSS